MQRCSLVLSLALHLGAGPHFYHQPAIGQHDLYIHLILSVAFTLFRWTALFSTQDHRKDFPVASLLIKKCIQYHVLPMDQSTGQMKQWPSIVNNPSPPPHLLKEVPLAVWG